MREDFAKKKAQWDNEKTSVERVQKIREEIEQVNNEIQKAPRDLMIWRRQQNFNTEGFRSCRNNLRKKNSE